MSVKNITQHASVGPNMNPESQGLAVKTNNYNSQGVQKKFCQMLRKIF